MRMAIATAMIILTTVCGCMSVLQESGCALLANKSLQEIKGEQLQSFLGQCDRHVLVEFGMNSNCGRCEFMKPDVAELAKKYDGYAAVVHVDYMDNQEMVSGFGGTACPTYVLFEKGEPEPIFIGSFPVSKDNLEAELLAVLAFSTN